MERLNTAVLISGRGSNLEALLAACRRDDFPARIGLVIANRAEAGGLRLAEAAGVPTRVVDHAAHADRAAFEAAIDAALREAGCRLICLAGFMRILTPAFIAAWPERILNIHPSLLPAFRGMHTHRAALAAGVRLHGCTVHLVSAELDAGPILAQAAVPVLAGDDEPRLAARVLAAEHALYPLALENYCRRLAGLPPSGAAGDGAMLLNAGECRDSDRR